MKYYIIAGEASGDLHASNLMKEIYTEDPQAIIRFWGGDLMQQVGGTLVKHYRDLAFMGFLEVAMNLRTIFKNISICKEDITRFSPDVIVYVDYPGFNLRIAKWARKKGYNNQYYISPQIWAWNEKRIKEIKRDMHAMYVILPFEKDFYEKKHNFPVHFVGHPLIDAIYSRKQLIPKNFRKDNALDDRDIIALLPGSRKQEIEKMMKIMLSVLDDFPQYQFIIAGAPSQDADFYAPYLKKKQVHLVMNKTYDVLSMATAALVTSGTATLETALFKVPEVVCYKGGRVSYEIAKRLIKLKYISLVNLIMDREVVKELIQNEFNRKNIKRELAKILEEGTSKRLFEDYYTLEKKLGGMGASKKTAQLIVKSIKNE